MTEEKLALLFAQGEDLGLRLELTDSGITWEAFPSLGHQKTVFRIQTSLSTGQKMTKPCDCFQAADVDIALPDGTIKRPDVSIWCREPQEQEGFVHAVPEAVVEIVSPGYEDKDLVHGPPIYLRNGVKDIIVFDRAKGEVHHWTPDGHRILSSPTVFELACGCRVTV